jgi:mono/diheme cytochrome c family protein
MEGRLMRSQFAVLAGVFALSAWAMSVSAQAPTPKPTAPDHDHAAAGQHEAGAHTHPAAAKLTNAVKSTPESIAAGKKIYDTQCMNCHGESGKGDGKMAASITGEKPSDLTDASWKHGSSDGEIFTLIRDGSKGTGMRGFATKLKTDDIWNVVNYLRTLGPKPAKSR